ncbi:hypothetical protein TNIN_404281 [Trichonephila inaurata madagascariensis]|uniref:Uncharacterized protein n=1 Tax=Trichonephila inaurata madagascariensis TaxID=2747483 RepID=A0A8X7BQT5_9ARAC|nr:hypothetical protein TNIN_404281 [Trichonephila inaurata madagascariensis]
MLTVSFRAVVKDATMQGRLSINVSNIAAGFTHQLIRRGYVKSMVHRSPVNSSEDLVVCIATAVGDVWDNPAIFNTIRSLIRRRFVACITSQGRNFKSRL